MKFVKRNVEKSEGGSSVFLKLKDGESVTGVFRGELYEFYNKWVDNRSRVTTPDDPEGRSRFRANFVIQEDGKFVAKIWEFTTMTHDQIADVAEEYEITETKVKVTRRGTGTDTTYSVIPAKDKLTEKQLKALEDVPLNVLEHKQEVPF